MADFPIEVRKWFAWLVLRLEPNYSFSIPGYTCTEPNPRIDVSGCSTQGIPPRFPLTNDFNPIPTNPALRPITPEENIPLELHPSPVAMTLTSNLRTQFPSQAEIFSLFDNASSLISRLKLRLLDSKRNRYQNAVWSSQNIHPLMHRLLSYRAPVDFDSLGSVIQEVCRLGLLLFFT
jgi:hypothetical protein